MADATEPSKNTDTNIWWVTNKVVKDLVHDLQFLTNTQRMTYFLQHLEGEGKRVAVLPKW